MNTFDVTLLPDAKSAIATIDDDYAATSQWSLFDVDVVPGYVSAFAIRS
jgi:hypothetical protein